MSTDTWKSTLLLWPWGSPKQPGEKSHQPPWSGTRPPCPPTPRNFSPAPLPPLHKHQWSKTPVAPQVPKIRRHLPWWTYGGCLDPESTRPQKGMRAAQRRQWWQAAPAPPTPQSGCTPAQPTWWLRKPRALGCSVAALSTRTPHRQQGLSQVSRVRRAHQGGTWTQTSRPPAPLPRVLKAWLPNARIKNSYRKVTWTCWTVASQQAFYFSLENKPLTNMWISFCPKTITSQTAGFTMFWVPMPPVSDYPRVQWDPSASLELPSSSLTSLKCMTHVWLSTYCNTATSQAA